MDEAPLDEVQVAATSGQEAQPNTPLPRAFVLQWLHGLLQRRLYRAHGGQAMYVTTAAQQAR